MKKSEKLLDVIGQIDDRLIAEAFWAGKNPEADKKKTEPKKVAMFRYRGALAACAALVICLGLYGFVKNTGLLLSPFEAKQPRTAEDAAEPFEQLADSVTESADRAVGKQGRSSQAKAVAEEDILPAEDSLALAQNQEEALPQTASLLGAEEQTTAILAVVEESSAAGIRFSVENQGTEAELSYGTPYELEQETPEGWMPVEIIGEVAWEDMLLVLAPGESRTEEIDFRPAYGELEPGSYRLKKEYTITTPSGSETGESVNETLYIAFEVTP